MMLFVFRPLLLLAKMGAPHNLPQLQNYSQQHKSVNQAMNYLTVPPPNQHIFMAERMLWLTSALALFENCGI